MMPEYASPEEALAAQVVATADLIGQMASRDYLERLLLLYEEFREAGIAAYAHVHEMLENTSSFHRLMSVRLEKELGGLAPYLTRHFAAERGVDRNYYLEAIERNLDYLAELVNESRKHRLKRLRRSGIVARLRGRETTATPHKARYATDVTDH